MITQQRVNYSLYLFPAPGIFLHGTFNFEASDQKVFKNFLTKLRCDPKQFCRVSMDNLPMMEDGCRREKHLY